MPDLLALNGQIIGGVPLPGENYVKLWENKNPTVAFESQNIDLSSDDYDFLLCISKIYTNVETQSSVIASKGNIFQLIFSDDGSVETRTRKFIYVSDTRLLVGDAYANGTKNNNYCIPLAIYGIKKDALAAGSGGAGGGHIIEDADGTDLDQQDTLQFKGTLRATNDAQNGKTIIDDSAVEIEWDDWQAMTEQEREAYLAENPKVDILNFPDADADLQFDFLTKLWENPNPNASFALQDINLNSDDYDFLVVTARITSSLGISCSLFVPKGYAFWLSTAHAGAGGSIGYRREVARISDTQFRVDDGYSATGATAFTQNNTCMIPLAIYGFKKKITVTVDAIAENVSTSASKCMLEDGETSVEDVITENELQPYISVASYTESNPYVCPSDGYFAVSCASGGSITGRVSSATNTTSFVIGTTMANVPSVVFVKKGMRINVRTSSGTTYAEFYPLSKS